MDEVSEMDPVLALKPAVKMKAAQSASRKWLEPSTVHDPSISPPTSKRPRPKPADAGLDDTGAAAGGGGESHYNIEDKHIAEPAVPKQRRDRKQVLKGRGCGRGRGLDFRGEPPFQDMHPSWQAHRRKTRRETKAVTKALRVKDGPALEVVHLSSVPSAAQQ
jgi:hypothetical protein